MNHIWSATHLIRYLPTYKYQQQQRKKWIVLKPKSPGFKRCTLTFSFHTFYPFIYSFEIGFLTISSPHCNTLCERKKTHVFWFSKQNLLPSLFISTRIINNINRSTIQAFCSREMDPWRYFNQKSFINTWVLCVCTLKWRDETKRRRNLKRLYRLFSRFMIVHCLNPGCWSNVHLLLSNMR